MSRDCGPVQKSAIEEMQDEIAALLARCEAAEKEVGRLREANERLREEDKRLRGVLNEKVALRAEVEEWRTMARDATTHNGILTAELSQYKRLLSEQVSATDAVTKELNSCYAELGIFRHPDEPDRGPEGIKRMREAVEWACNSEESKLHQWQRDELRRRAKEG